MVVVMGKFTWMLNAIVPGMDRRPLKKLSVNKDGLLSQLHSWRMNQVAAGSRLLMAHSRLRYRTSRAISVPVTRELPEGNQHGLSGASATIIFWVGFLSNYCLDARACERRIQAEGHVYANLGYTISIREGRASCPEWQTPKFDAPWFGALAFEPSNAA